MKLEKLPRPGKMTEKEYFEFLEEYFRLFSDKEPEREKIEMDPALIKL